MKTHNALIYHCESCGRVEHAELQASEPQCCGRAMEKACGESVPGADAKGQAINDSVEDQPAPKAGQKPR